MCFGGAFMWVMLGAVSVFTIIRMYVTKWIERLFTAFGMQVWDNPLIPLAIGCILTIIGSCGWLYRDMEFGEMELWLPTADGCYQRKSYDFLTEYYSDDYILIPSQSNFFSFIVEATEEDAENANILHSSLLSQVFEIEQLLSNFSWDNTRYSDYCYLGTAKQCSSDAMNIFHVFNYNQSLVEDQRSVEYILKDHNYIIDEEYLVSLEYGDFMELWLGSGIWQLTDHNNIALNHKETYSLSYGTSLHFEYYLSAQYEGDEMFEFILKLGEYLSHISPNYPGLEIVFTSSAIITREQHQVIWNTAYLFCISLASIFVWIIILRRRGSGCLKQPWIDLRLWLSVFVIFTVLCSLAFGFGFTFYCGIKFNFVCIVVPFLILGIGANNTMVICDAFSKQINVTEDDGDDDAQKRFAVCILQTGHCLSLTFVSSCVPFLFAYIAEIPAISAFASFMIWSFVGLFLFQFLIFVPLFVYDIRRMESQRNFFLPCIVHTKIAEDPVYNKNIQNDEAKDEESELEVEEDDFIKIEAQSWAEQLLWKIKSYLIFKNTFCTALVFLIAVTIMCLSLAAAIAIKQSFDISHSRAMVLPTVSDTDAYYAKFEEMFPNQFVTDSHFMVQNVELANDTNKLLHYFESLNNMSDQVKISEVYQWVTLFLLWSNDTNVTDGDIYDVLRDEFLVAYPMFEQYILFDDEKENIFSTKFSRHSYAIEPIGDYFEYEKVYKDIAVASELTDTYYFDTFMVYAYLQETLRNGFWKIFLFGVLTVFAIQMMFADMIVLLLTLTTVFAVNLGLFLWMFINGMEVWDPFIYTLYIFSVGITVNLMIYITHHLMFYLKERDQNIKRRRNGDLYYKKRLDFVLVSIQQYCVNGFITVFICILPLCANFLEFFIMLTGLVFLTYVYGFFFIPNLIVVFLPLFDVVLGYSQKFLKEQSKKEDGCCSCCRCCCVCLNKVMGAQDDETVDDEERWLEDGDGDTEDLVGTDEKQTELTENK